jgi:nitroreductase
MESVHADTVLGQLKWRYAAKKFDATKKIPAATWSAIEQAMQLSPSSYGLTPWKFVVVQNPELRAKLRPISWGQPQITDASHLVVFCRRQTTTPSHIDAYIQRIMAVRSVPAAALEGYKGMMVGTFTNPPANSPAVQDIWASRQVYIALGFFLYTCAMLGVDACPMEGIEAEKYDDVLGLKGSGFASLVAGAAGYRASDDAVAAMKKVRPLESDVVMRM